MRYGVLQDSPGRLDPDMAPDVLVGRTHVGDAHAHEEADVVRSDNHLLHDLSTTAVA